MTQESKHTPGPWRFDYEYNSPNIAIIDEDGDNVIAELEDWGGEFEDEMIANAELIASAPALLAELGALKAESLRQSEIIAEQFLEKANLKKKNADLRASERELYEVAETLKTCFEVAKECEETYIKIDVASQIHDDVIKVCSRYEEANPKEEK